MAYVQEMGYLCSIQLMYVPIHSQVTEDKLTTLTPTLPYLYLYSYHSNKYLYDLRVGTLGEKRQVAEATGMEMEVKCKICKLQ